MLRIPSCHTSQAAGKASLILENLELRDALAPVYTGGGGAIASDGAELTLQVRVRY